MMGFIVLDDKVEVQAIEVVGLFVEGGNPATETAAEAVVEQNVVFIASWARRHGGSLISE